MFANTEGCVPIDIVPASVAVPSDGPPMLMGWICPKCGEVNGPFSLVCNHCPLTITCEV